MVNEMNLKQRIAALLLLPLFLLMALPIAAEAARFRQGDTVQVYHDFWKEWYNGTVVAVGRNGQVKVEYQPRLGSRLKTEIFNQGEVRFAYEEDAFAPARNWTDASGSFKVMAAPLAIQGDMLKIRKPDFTELEVPISKLSDGDQRYLERLKRELGGAASPTPEHLQPIQFADNIGESEIQAAFTEDDRIAILPDPLPPYLKLQQGGAAFGKNSDEEEFGVIIPVGGPQSLVLASAESHPRRGDPATRLIWVSIAEKKPITQQKLPPDEYVLDYHPPSHRLLTYSFIKGDDFGFDKKIALALWEVLPTDAVAKPIVRWEAHPEDGTGEEPWARIIDGRIVLQRWDKGEYVGWNVDQKAVAYRLRQEAFRASLPAFSGNKKYAFLPENDQVRIFDPLSGSIMTSIPAPNGAKAVALSEDGTKAAVLDDHQLAVWDLTNAEAQPVYYPADDIGRVPVTSMFWLGDDKLMVKTFFRDILLFSLSQRIVLWNYQFEHGTTHGDTERPLVHVVNDHLVYGASLRDDNRNEGLAVGNVTLPGPKVGNVFDTIDREDLEVTKPGERVRLDVRCGNLNKDAYYALLAKIEENGWVLDQENPTMTMLATFGKGKSQTTTYRSMFGLSSGRQEVTVSYTPNVYKIQLTKANEVIWSGQTQSGSPMFMSLRQGETAQGKVDQAQVPNVSFFKGADIPSRIIHKDYRRGLGTTQVTTRGLIAGDLKPPPVTTDPTAPAAAEGEDPFTAPAAPAGEDPFSAPPASADDDPFM